jgi:hypothetical protein
VVGLEVYILFVFFVSVIQYVYLPKTVNIHKRLFSMVQIEGYTVFFLYVTYKVVIYIST